MLITLCWWPQLQRALWHDEEQVAFAARTWLATGQRAYFDGQAIVGENLNHPLNEDWDLEVMSSGEIWCAAFGKKIADAFGFSEPWRYARLPFLLAGVLCALVLASSVAQVTSQRLMGFLAFLSWLVIPWTWTLSAQLRYYPLSWLLIVLGLSLWARPGAWHVFLQSLLIFGLYLVNWVLAPLLVLLYFVMDRFRSSTQRLSLGAIILGAGLPIALHLFFVSNLISGISSLKDRWDQVFWVFRVHLAEFNLDVFPVLLLLGFLIFGWQDRSLRPWLAGCLTVVGFLLIPSLYTRLALMFLPLFIFTGMLIFNRFVVSKPGWTLLAFLLWATTHFYQSLPGAILQKISPTLGQQVMPLNRSLASVFENPKKAWTQVFDFQNTSLNAVQALLENHVKSSEQVICAMGGTGLQRRTGLTFNWKKPQWVQDRPVPSWLSSPQGVKAVVVRKQWPYLTRQVTWTAEILKGIEKGWIRAEKFVLSFKDLRYFNNPFPFSLERQAWPMVEPLEVWILEEPITQEQSRWLENLNTLPLIRPQGMSKDLKPDVVWGWPASKSR